MMPCAAAAGTEEPEGQVVEGRPLAAAATGGTRAGGGREPEGLTCPRCDSTNTKFCYYNNYNHSQPRHFCRACRRYWTRGGALRNVPVGGGTRKSTTVRRKRGAAATGASPPAPAATTSPSPPALPMPPPQHGGLPMLRPYDLSSFAAAALASPLAAVGPDRRLLDLGGSFSSLIAPAPDGHHHFSAGFLLGGLAPAASMARAPAPATAPPPPPPPYLQPPQQQQPVSQQALPEGFVWSMGWPDLSI